MSRYVPVKIRKSNEAALQKWRLALDMNWIVFEGAQTDIVEDRVSNAYAVVLTEAY